MNVRYHLTGSVVILFLSMFLSCFQNTIAATWTIVSDTGDEASSSMYLSSTIMIKGDEAFDSWFQENTGDDRFVYFFVNGLKPGIQSGLRLRNSNNGLYSFEFDRSAITSAFWPVIRTRTQDSPYFTRRVDLAFGSDTAIDRSMGSQQVELVLVRKMHYIAWFLVIIALVLFFLTLANRSNIMRAGEPPAPGLRPPMSLARTQMALWLFIIIGCYVWIWLVSGNLGSTNSTVLILLGIASGTYVGSVFIESTSESAQSMIPGGTAPGVKQPPQRGILKLEQKWYMQLLSDNSGVKLHRFQILAWTVVLCIIFVVETVKSLEMPEFPSTLLGLLGISTGTYLGFKFPELKAQDQQGKV